MKNGRTSAHTSQKRRQEPSRMLSGGRYVLITGGSGFVGANLAHRLLSSGERVVVYDNLSRAGVGQNYEWLLAEYGNDVALVHADTRDADRLAEAVRGASAVFHFAAQVAVTTSLLAPREDFEINVGGTLNLLEALRSMAAAPPLIFTSTNKVYGDLCEVALEELPTRYEPKDPLIRARGINEGQRLDFHSPYGCSKGAADAYILDYARSYGLDAIVFRMSCIYGPRQFGTEDQGWVAHFLIRALEGESITLYGDGRQVRDILFVDDLVEAFVQARANARRLRGQVFNIGGGPRNTTSLLELVELIATLTSEPPWIEHDNWRPGDQRYYVSDTRKFSAATGWQPRVNVEEGVRRLLKWLRGTRIASPALAAFA